MEKFTVEELTFILSKIYDGKPGYSENIRVARLQAKLSIHLEVASMMGRRSDFDLAEFYQTPDGRNPNGGTD